MSSRRTKQVIYGLAFLVFWAFILWAVYALFFKPAPSCFDGIQNEGEAGVDCGGLCAKICIPSTIQPVATIGTVAVFAPLAGHATLLAEVVDPNPDFAADSVSYTFDLYDASGNIIQSIPGTAYIYADQTEYLVVPNAAVSALVDHAALTVQNIHWVPASEMGLVPQFTFKNLETVPGLASGTLAVDGQIVDADPASFTNIEIVAVLRSPGGAPAGVSETEIDGIAPNQAENFSLTYPATENIDPSQTQVYAYAER